MLNWKLFLKILLILLLQVSLVEYAFGAHFEVEGSPNYKFDKRIEESRRTDLPFVFLLPQLSIPLIYEETTPELVELKIVLLKSLVIVGYNAERSPPLPLLLS